MPSVIYPYTVTNSYKGGLFMRTYSRNVRRAWDGEDYRAPKRQRLDNVTGAPLSFVAAGGKEHSINPMDLEDNLERAIRETSVAALSSSPSRKNSTVFSLESLEDDNDSNTVTPPSSPPPTLQITPPNIKPRKPTFATLDKKKREKEKLKLAKRKADALYISTTTASSDLQEGSKSQGEIQNSSSRAQNAEDNATSNFPANSSQLQSTSAPREHADPTDAASDSISIASLEKPAPKKQNLVQTILDLGQSLIATTCSQCQMSYTPSIPEDVALHNMWHNRHSQGIDLGKPFLKSAMKWCYEVPHIPGSVVVVDRKISVPGRKAVQRVLEVINKELGSVDIKEEELWSQRILEGEDGRKSDRYKVFLHVINGKCVGVCLAERISKAHRVVADQAVDAEEMRINSSLTPTSINSPQQPPTQMDVEKQQPQQQLPEPQHPLTPIASSSINVSEETYPAVVGVSRIWTSRAFRRKGIANNLLDCVLNQFIYGMEMERSDLAFSQPTESGALLARSWFGEEEWTVYREE